MKKVIAVALCVIMMMTMMPMLFASAADTAVAAQDDLADLWTTVTGWSDLWGGLLKLILGQDFLKQIFPALKDLFMGGLSIGDFFSSLADMWAGISYGM